MQLPDPKKLWSEMLEHNPRLAMSGPGLAFLMFEEATQNMEAQRFYKAIDQLAFVQQQLPNDAAAAKFFCAVGYHRAFCNLCLGKYDPGLREAEFRKLFNKHPGDRINLVEWRGEDIAGKRLLVYQDQGYGDVIAALRFIPQLKASGADITMMISLPLHPLAAQFHVKLVGELIDGKGYDYKVPLLGLLSVLKVTPETVPSAPYLRAPPRPIWDGCANRIGIAWSGSARFAKDAQRSIPLGQFMELLKPPAGSKLYALQTTDLDEAEKYGIAAPRIEDFGDTAGLIMSMDHVVCVDTSPIHVAGALGHPSTHVMLPFAQHWVWHRGDNWYPTIRRHRQKIAGDWREPFEWLNAALEATAIPSNASTAA